MKVLVNERREVEKRNVYSLLEIFDMESRQRRIIKEFEELIEAPNWRKDGKELVYNSGGRLFRFVLETKEIIPVESVFCNQCNNDHVLSPVDDRVAVSHHTREDGESRIYILPLAGEAEGVSPTLITPIAPSYLHGWSPDGKTLAYCGERNGEYDIYTISAKGGEEKQLTFAKGLSDGPEFAPDGKSIWFNSVRSGLMQVWKMDADGENQVQITDTESNNWFPHVSPDGKKVVYIAYRKGDVEPGDHPANKNVEIHMMNPDGSGDEVLVSLFGGQGTINVNSWSPDGKQFAFVSYRLK
ncbi:MAG: hypothetical protein NC400_09705 [Clostridium sp.]|nr:hypothetical protein [Clostridium sp.]